MAPSLNIPGLGSPVVGPDGTYHWKVGDADGGPRFEPAPASAPPTIRIDPPSAGLVWVLIGLSIAQLCATLGVVAAVIMTR